MNCVYKDYKVKIKMMQEQSLQLKLKFSLGYNMEKQMGELIFGGVGKSLVGGVYWGVFFLVGEWEHFRLGWIPVFG